MKQSDFEHIKIDRGLPKPNVSRMRSNGFYYLFEQMNINDSFAIPFTTQEEAKKIQAKISKGRRNYRSKYNPKFNGTCRILYTKNEVDQQNK